MNLNRREFIWKLMMAGTALPLFMNSASLSAASKLINQAANRKIRGDKRDNKEPFHWARVKFKVVEDVPDKWDISPWGDDFFLNMLHAYTDLNVDRTWHVAPLDDLEEMVKYPFLFMTSEGDFEFNRKHQENFVEYLSRGGFIFADDCVYNNDKGLPNDRFFSCMKDKLETLFGKKMIRLPDDHEIYRNYYKLKGLPYMQGQAHGGYALFIDGRMAVFLSPHDIHCGWCSMSQVAAGQESWFSRKKSSDSVKMGINILIYAMTH